MVNRVGRLVGTAPRSVSTADSVWPEDTSVSAGFSGAVDVPTEATGGIAHVHVDLVGTGATVAARAHVFGWRNDTRVSIHNDSSKGQIGRWYFIGSLNGNADITSTTCGGFLDTSNNSLSYAEALLHIAPYTRLLVLFTNFTALGSATGTILFEV